LVDLTYVYAVGILRGTPMALGAGPKLGGKVDCRQPINVPLPLTD